MSTIRRKIRRRRGAGMTEYIILVGLIAILLAGIVERYKTQIEVTIVGTNGVGGMAGNTGVGGIGNAMGSGGGKKTVPASSSDPNAFKDASGNWVKYQ